MLEYPIIHVETVEIRGLEEISDGTLGGSFELLGTLVNIVFFRVKDNEVGIQIADGDPNTQDCYNDLCMMFPGRAFQTTQLDGYEGEWVMTTVPYER